MTAPARLVLDRHRSPRRGRRLISLLLLDGFRAAPRQMWLVTFTLLLGSTAVTCYPVGFRMLVDGAYYRSAGEAVTGAIVLAVLMSTAWMLTAIGASSTADLANRLAVYRTGHLVELVSSISTVDHFERPEYADEIDRLSTARRAMAGAPRQLMNNFASGLRLVVLVALLISVSPWLALLPLCAIPPLACGRVANRVARRCEEETTEPRRLAAKYFELMVGADAAAELRVYGSLPYLSERHTTLCDELDARVAVDARRALVIRSCGWLIFAGGLVVAIAFVLARAAAGALSVGTVLMALALIQRSRTQLASAAATSGALVSVLESARRLLWLEDHARECAESAGTADAPTILTEGVTFERVTFRYPGAERDALHDVTVTLRSGSTVALVGENGSGKSTMVKLLLGLHRPGAGVIRINGTRLDDIDPVGWSRNCSAALQDFSRFELSAVECVGIGEVEHLDDYDAARAALTEVGAGTLEMRLGPRGLGTELGRGGEGNLSSGQWQQLSLARAFRRRYPMLIVLDEPTASLDPVAQDELLERYSGVARRSARTGAVSVLVSHGLASARLADVIVHLDGGQVIEAGSHAELMRADGPYARLFRLQANGFAAPSRDVGAPAAAASSVPAD